MNLAEIKDFELEDIIYLLFKDKHGKGVILTNTQLKIVKAITSLSHDEVCIAAYTGYGKTFLLAIAELLTAWLNDGIKIGHISISSKQTGLCYDYILEFVSRQPLWQPLLATQKKDITELRKALNKERITIGNSIISIHTANLNQKGRNLLGLHFDMVVSDEDAEIPDEIDSERIGRMLEETPMDKARGMRKTHIRISTTHHRGHFKKSFDNPSVLTFRADDKVGLAELRVTPEFLTKRKKALGDYKYGIWYQCCFPEQEANKLFTDEEVRLMLKKVDYAEYKRAPLRVCSVDVARFGSDKSVITLIVKAGGQYYAKELKHFDSNTLTQLTGEVLRLDREYDFTHIIVDGAGPGGGVVDTLMETAVSVKVTEVNPAEKAYTESSDERYKNLASEAYDFLKKRASEGLIHYEENEFIREELLQIEFEFDSKGRFWVKKKGSYEEEAHSPDFVDSLAYGCLAFINKGGGAYGFA